VPDPQYEYAQKPAQLPLTPPKMSFRHGTREPETNQQSPQKPHISESRCETPRPLEPFLAIDAQDARRQATPLGLVCLYKELDKYTLFGRRRVYHALPAAFAERLLRLEIDMSAEDEFSEKEQAVLRDLAGKRWLKRMKTGEKTYYYHLDKETVAVLKKQMRELRLERNA